MAEEVLIKELQCFGLTKDEAEAYLLLLVAGPSPVGLICRRLKTNRMRIYRILDVLRAKGLTEAEIGRPTKFIATPLEEALSKSIEETKAKISKLEKSRQTIIDNWEKLEKQRSDKQSDKTTIEDNRFHIFQGRRQVYRALSHMIKKAKTEIRIITTIKDLSRLSLIGIDDELKELNRNGVKIRVLTEINLPWRALIEDYSSFSAVHHRNFQTIMRSIMVDEVESLTTFIMDDSTDMTTKDDMCIWTNAPNFVKTSNTRFDELWRDSTPASGILQRLETEQVPTEAFTPPKKRHQGKSIDSPRHLESIEASWTRKKTSLCLLPRSFKRL